MGLGAFYWEVLKRAFSGRFWYAEKISGGFALFFGLIAQPLGWGNAIIWAPFWVFIAVFAAAIVLGLILSPYELWREKEQEARSKEDVASSLRTEVESLKSIAPKLKVVINGIFWGGVSSRDDNISSIIIMTYIKNLGKMSSIATDWRIVLERGNDRHVFPLTYASNLYLGTDELSGRTIRLSEEDAIYNRASSPIPPGGMAQGFACATVPLDMLGEDAAGSRVLLECEDINGNVCTGERALQLGGELRYFPGMHFEPTEG